MKRAAWELLGATRLVRLSKANSHSYCPALLARAAKSGAAASSRPLIFLRRQSNSLDSEDEA